MLNILQTKVANKTLKIGIFGLGYVGLPLAVAFGKAGLAVTGFDVDEKRVGNLNKGLNHIEDVADDDIKMLVGNGNFRASADFSKLSEVDAVCICVPTPLRKTKEPDMSYIVAAVEQLEKYIHPGMIVILESTTYPGTTDEILQPRLEAKGLKCGKDLFLCFSPERIDPGNKQFGLKNTPKVIGGITPACSQAAEALYGSIVDKVIKVSSTRAAETVKLLENTFRLVNIALVNEIAEMCHVLNMNVWEIIDAAASKPFGYMPFYPGPGIGGHCIPLDPHYLSWKLRSFNFNSRFIELAADVNSRMPEFVVDLVAQELNNASLSIRGSKILILGLSYKANVADMRESPAIDVIEKLHQRGALLSYSDPFIPNATIKDLNLKSIELSAETIASHDLVMVITSHRDVNYDLVLKHAKLILDTRNVYKNVVAGNLRKL